MARPKLASMLKLQSFDPDEDRNAAPGGYAGDNPARPWTWQRAKQNLAWVYLLGLIFMTFAVAAVFDGDPGPGRIALGLTICLAIAVAYLATSLLCDAPLVVRIAYTVGFIALLATLSEFLAVGFLYYAVYVAVMIAILIPWRFSRIAIVVWGVAGIVTGAVYEDSGVIAVALTGLSIGLAMGGGMEAGRLGRKLDRAQQRVSVLAVAAERERIARDLHDILGHSLTAISIKSALAGKLIGSDPAGAQQQILEVEEIARQALADVRSTASAIRQTRVASEVASARSVLMAAGIEATVPSAIEPMPAERSEVLGYVVREAVTNIVRHSDASSAVILVGRDGVSIADDGRGLAARSPNGTGLAGLLERVRQAGGELTVTSGPAGGTVVRADFAPPPEQPAPLEPDRNRSATSTAGLS